MIIRIIALAVMLTATPANACRVPREPFDPALTHSDIIIVGRVTNVRIDDPIRGKWFRVRVQAVIAGMFTETSFEAGWQTGSGACSPLGPDVAEGDQVAVYFLDRDGTQIEQGWTKIASDATAHRKPGASR